MTIATVRYTAGDHLAVVWPGGVVLLDSSVAPGVAAATWERLRNLPVPSTLDAVLTEVAEAIGARLLDLPPFAIAVTTGPGAAHVATRGSFEIEATSADLSTAHVTGAGVATWSERQLSSVVRMRISDGRAPEGASLPVGSAVVAAGVVVVAEATAAAAPLADAADDLDGFGPKDPDATSRADDSGHWVGLADVAEERASEPEPEAEPVAEPDGFDDIWADHTVAGSVEGAAVRPGADLPPSPPPVVAPVQPSRSSDVTWLEDDEVREPSGSPEHDSEEPPVDKAPTLAPPGDFISSVPGMPPVAPPPTPPPAFPSPAFPPPSFPPPSVPPPPGPPPSAPPPASAPAVLGDHDGDTVAGPVRAVESTPVPARAADPGLLAVVCPSGHGNPPQRARCRVCDEPLTASPTRIPQPSLGRVLVSTGEQAELTGPVIIGRAPRASRFQGTAVPRLVTVQHPHISASHVALRVEGWSVLAVDLNSTNGTFLRRNGEPPFRVLEQPQLLVPGDVIDLGHGVHLRFEELP